MEQVDRPGFGAEPPVGTPVEQFGDCTVPGFAHIDCEIVDIHRDEFVDLGVGRAGV